MIGFMYMKSPFHPNQAVEDDHPPHARQDDMRSRRCLKIAGEGPVKAISRQLLVGVLVASQLLVGAREYAGS